MSNTFIILLTRQRIQKNLFFVIIFCVTLSSCINKGEHGKKRETRFITDMNERVVEIPTQINKIVAHRSGALRYVCYLNATDYIIGIEASERRRQVPYIFANPQLRELPLIGAGNNADPELLARINPDLIICTYLNTGEADELQSKTGIPVVCINYGDFSQHKNDFYNSLNFLGELLNREDRADSLINYIKNSISEIQSRCEQTNSNQHYYVGGLAFRGAHGINSTEPFYAPFKICGQQNVADELAKNSKLPFNHLNNMVIDKEQLINWNPDKIFVDVAGLQLSREDLEKSSVLGSSLSAIQNDEVYTLLPHIWNTINYEHILINSFYVAKLSFPEQFKDVDITQKADEIYRMFLNKPLYSQMKEYYGYACQKLNLNE